MGKQKLPGWKLKKRKVDERTNTYEWTGRKRKKKARAAEAPLGIWRGAAS